MNSRAQIVATIGPASNSPEMLKSLIGAGMDIARINFAWFPDDNETRIEDIRNVSRECGRAIPIIADLPGPRVQQEHGHTYDASAEFSLTEKDKETLALCAHKQIEYVALSFVGNAEDIARYRDVIKSYGGTQKVIAKIERKAAVEALDEIIAASDAIMIARGDLGQEVPLEEIPFIQQSIIEKAGEAGKPVIVATQMLLSMVEHPEPTRAEVTDVEAAIQGGADAVMLSEETASGKYPVEAVKMMERILLATERHYADTPLHPL